MRNTYKRIGLIDHQGMGNMGDASIQEAFIANITSRLPNAVLIAFSMNPEDTAKRHNIPAYPITWLYPGWNGPEPTDPGFVPEQKPGLKTILKRFRPFHALAKPVLNCLREIAHLIRTYRVVKSLDLLVFSGGGQLCDLHRELPHNVFKFCVLAKLSNTPVFIVGVGADLLALPISRFFAKWSVRMARYASFRSLESQVLIRQIGVTKETHVCPDPAYSLDVKDYIATSRSDTLTETDARLLLRSYNCLVDAPDERVAPKSSKTLKPRVGLNPIGFCDPRRWPRKDDAVYQRYLDKVEAFSAWLLAHNYQVEIFTSDIIVDVYAIQDLKSRLSRSLSPEAASDLVVRPILTLRELLVQMSGFDYVVTSKFHGVLFSHLLAKPVLALSYMPKIEHLMRSAGHDRYCLDVEHFDGKSVIERFQSMVEEREHLKALFRRTTAAYADVLDREFDNLFGERPATTAQVALGRSVALDAK